MINRKRLRPVVYLVVCLASLYFLMKNQHSCFSWGKLLAFKAAVCLFVTTGVVLVEKIKKNNWGWAYLAFSFVDVALSAFAFWVMWKKQLHCHRKDVLFFMLFYFVFAGFQTKIVIDKFTEQDKKNRQKIL